MSDTDAGRMLQTRPSTAIATPSNATTLTALELELRASGASAAARQVLLNGGPLWQIILYVQLVEDGVSAARLSGAVESRVLQRHQTSDWVSSQLDKAFRLLNVEPAVTAFDSTLGRTRSDDALPGSLRPIIEAAALMSRAFAEVVAWRAEVVAAVVPPEWEEVRAVVSSTLDPLREGLEELLLRLKADLVTARHAFERGERPAPLVVDVSVRKNSILPLLPDALQRARVASEAAEYEAQLAQAESRLQELNASAASLGRTMDNIRENLGRVLND